MTDTPRTSKLISRAGFMVASPDDPVVLRRECALIEQELQRELSAALAREKLAWNRGHAVGLTRLREAEKQWATARDGMQAENAQLTDRMLQAEAALATAQAEIDRLTTASEKVIRRLQMDIDDGGRPDQWSMEDMVRTLRDVIPTPKEAT